jgi:hypothetical protein
MLKYFFSFVRFAGFVALLRSVITVPAAASRIAPAAEPTRDPDATLS